MNKEEVYKELDKIYEEAKAKIETILAKLNDIKVGDWVISNDQFKEYSYSAAKLCNMDKEYVYSKDPFYTKNYYDNCKGYSYDRSRIRKATNDEIKEALIKKSGFKVGDVVTANAKYYNRYPGISLTKKYKISRFELVTDKNISSSSAVNNYAKIEDVPFLVIRDDINNVLPVDYVTLAPTNVVDIVPELKFGDYTISFNKDNNLIVLTNANLGKHEINIDHAKQLIERDNCTGYVCYRSVFEDILKVGCITGKLSEAVAIIKEWNKQFNK